MNAGVYIAHVLISGQLMRFEYEIKFTAFETQKVEKDLG